jgi:hypothetical protein
VHSIIGADRKPIPANIIIRQQNAVHQMTWWPGEDTFIIDRLITDGGGWTSRSGFRCLNLYRPAIVSHGDASRASKWVKHVERLYGDDAKHIIDWCAHRVQHPGEKINHALVLGGAQGIGKDTLLAPLKYAVGAHNFADVSPSQVTGRFNGFLKSVVLRVSELRDLGDTNRFGFYEHMKTLTAAPPDVLRIDEKNRGEYYSMNCCGVIMTTNHKSGGIYLPADDRRHFVAWSSLDKDDFTKQEWDGIWNWYEHGGGYEDVAAFLAERDLSEFNAKAPPPKTDAFWDIVASSAAPEDAEIADIIEVMGEVKAGKPNERERPQAFTLGQLRAAATGDIIEWLGDRKNRRQIPHRLESCGYVPVRNAAAKDGLWKLDGARQAIYALASLPINERVKAAEKLASEPKPVR